MSNVEKVGNLTKKTYTKTVWHAMAAQNASYPGAGNFCLPWIRISLPTFVEVYGDRPDEITKKQKRYINEYFNTESTVGCALYGAMIAIEASGTPDATDIADNLKIALMGPFAGIGDSIYKVGGKVIFSAMAGYMALDGSALGLLICFAWSCFTLLSKYWFFTIGYNKGTEFITTMSDKLNLVTSTISVMGLIVIGNCIPSTVKLTTKVVLQYGESAKKLQEILDSIFPYLLPCLATFVMYKLLAVKGMTTTKLIYLALAFFTVLSFFNIV